MLNRSLSISKIFAGSSFILSASSFAAGFQLNEFSSVGLGRAYSGEGAIADTAASASRNPATMTLMDRPELSVGAIVIDPAVDLNGQSPLSGRSLSSKNTVKSEVVPNFHYVHRLNDQFWIGASATTNYGLSTQIPNTYPAGPFAGKTKLETSNLNLSSAWKINDSLSVGLGFDALYARAELNRTAGEVFTTAGIPASTQISHLKGHRWGFGWNGGILYNVDENNRYGLTYRSEIKVKFKGNYSSQLPSALNPIWINQGVYGTDGNSIPGHLNLNLPAVWEASGWHHVAPKWDIHYSVAYTEWNSFKQLRATADDGTTLFEKEEQFGDSWRIALGTTYHYNANWKARAGVAYDDSPVKSKYRSISIPDQDRIWLTTGLSWQMTDAASVDVALAYMHGQRVDIKEGPYRFESKGEGWLYGASFNYRF